MSNPHPTPETLESALTTILLSLRTPTPSPHALGPYDPPAPLAALEGLPSLLTAHAPSVRAASVPTLNRPSTAQTAFTPWSTRLGRLLLALHAALVPFLLPSSPNAPSPPSSPSCFPSIIPHRNINSTSTSHALKTASVLLKTCTYHPRTGLGPAPLLLLLRALLSGRCMVVLDIGMDSLGAVVRELAFETSVVLADLDPIHTFLFELVSQIASLLSQLSNIPSAPHTHTGCHTKGLRTLPDILRLLMHPLLRKHLTSDCIQHTSPASSSPRVFPNPHRTSTMPTTTPLFSVPSTPSLTSLGADIQRSILALLSNELDTSSEEQLARYIALYPDHWPADMILTRFGRQYHLRDRHMPPTLLEAWLKALVAVRVLRAPDEFEAVGKEEVRRSSHHDVRSHLVTRVHPKNLFRIVSELALDRSTGETCQSAAISVLLHVAVRIGPASASDVQARFDATVSMLRTLLSPNMEEPSVAKSIEVTQQAAVAWAEMCQHLHQPYAAAWTNLTAFSNVYRFTAALAKLKGCALHAARSFAALFDLPQAAYLARSDSAQALELLRTLLESHRRPDQVRWNAAHALERALACPSVSHADADAIRQALCKTLLEAKSLKIQTACCAALLKSFGLIDSQQKSFIRQTLQSALDAQHRNFGIRRELRIQQLTLTQSLTRGIDRLDEG